MHRIQRTYRLWAAIGIWALGLLVSAGLGWWNYTAFKTDAENRIISEAGRMSAQLAGLLSSSGGRLDTASAQAIIQAAMEDERVYAIKVDNDKGLVVGQRRNYLWEPMPWDDEINENCVQSINPVRIGGKVAGKVEVWLSPRLNAEEDSLFMARERLRFVVVFVIWTSALCLLLWYWGDFRRLLKPDRAGASEKTAASASDAKLLGLANSGEAHTSHKSPPEESEHVCLIDPAAARAYQKKNPEAWLVTAGLFRQTFSRAPHLLNRLYADGEIAGLCHLGRMLEQAAPCIGALPLERAAKAMQEALNNPGCEMRATPVEDCMAILEKTLVALGGTQRAKGTEGE